ncbi:MAG: hemerythrin family protein [Rhodocyclaceae bacterium]|nr:hemerythrin family protein [Rhodocyclaceae bacterium]
METFVWDQRFVTGIDIVDQQHRRLVDIINRLGEVMLAGDTLSEGRMQIVFKQLSDYAREHFSDEEHLMREAGLDPRHIDAHKQHHHQFVEQLASMWRARGSMRSPAGTLHGFLTAWLAFHILGEDQSMTRQIALVNAGESATTAFEVESQPQDNSTDALLKALRTLYHVLSEQNRDLAEANDRLQREIAANRD